MKNLAKWGLLSFALTAGSAAAQDTTTPKPDAFPVGETPIVQVGQTYTAETYGDWEMLCVKTAKGPEPCEVGQLALDEQANPIADVRIFPLPPGSQALAGSTIVTPLGALIANGIIINVDKKKPKQYPYMYCTTVGCVARVGFTALELQAMRTGDKMKISVVMASNAKAPVVIQVSLKGFSTAYAALSKKVIDAQKLQQGN